MAVCQNHTIFALTNDVLPYNETTITTCYLYVIGYTRLRADGHVYTVGPFLQ